MTEIEFWLSTIPARLQDVKRTLDAAGPTSVHATTYYDTADLKLRRHGLDLRIREGDGRCVQTFRSNGFTGGSLISSGEWQDVIASDRPDFTAPETGPRLREAIPADELRPLFTTIVHRTAMALEPRLSTRIEVTIDEGEIRDAEGTVSEPISEVGLKLRDGDPAAVYDMALSLLKVAPLRIETRSKSDRGYRMIAAGHEVAAVVHAAPITLQGSMTVENALQSIGRSCLGHLRGNELAALSDQADGVHQIRVAVRRLRTVLSAVKLIVPAEHYIQAQEDLKWLAHSLGPARNWDVFTANLLEPVHRIPEMDLKLLADSAEQRRRAACALAKETIESPRYTATMLKLTQWFEKRGWNDQPVSKEAALLFAAIGDVAPRLIERRWRQVRKRSRNFRQLPPEQRHELRIALKKLRYTIEFLRDLFDKDEVKALEKRLKPLQEDLGYMNDVRAAHDLVAEVSRSDGGACTEIARGGGIVLGWLSRGLSDRELKLRKEVRRLRRAKPFWPRVAKLPGRTK